MTIDEIKAAGIEPRHIQRVMHVSRVTASNWLRGVSHPHHLIAQRYDDFCRAVESATHAGELPVPTDFPPDERNVRIVAVLEKHLRDLKS